MGDLNSFYKCIQCGGNRFFIIKALLEAVCASCRKSQKLAEEKKEQQKKPGSG